jgi:hypothetical protein
LHQLCFLLELDYFDLRIHLSFQGVFHNKTHGLSSPLTSGTGSQKPAKDLFVPDFNYFDIATFSNQARPYGIVYNPLNFLSQLVWGPLPKSWNDLRRGLFYRRLLAPYIVQNVL